MNELDPVLIQLLRKMAIEHFSVAEMVRAFIIKIPSKTGHAIEALLYFQEAFGLTLAQAKPVADWIAHDKKSSDSELQRLVWPYIESQRNSWESQVEDRK